MRKRNEESDAIKKVNWAGIAAFIAAIATIPGMLINTYLDFKERNTSELIQRSSYQSLVNTVEDMGGDIEFCSNEIRDLKVEIAELKGYLRGMRGNSRRTHTSLPAHLLAGNESSDKLDSNKKLDQKSISKPPSFDSIKQHVQSTGEVYIAEKAD